MESANITISGEYLWHRSKNSPEGRIISTADRNLGVGINGNAAADDDGLGGVLEVEDIRTAKTRIVLEEKIA